MPYKPKTPLHEAVYRTVNKSLDSPEWIIVPRPLRTSYMADRRGTKLTQRFLRLIKELGYASEKTSSQSGFGKLYRGEHIVHPLAWEYYQLYGEEYLNQLEAAIRLRPLTPDCPDSDN